MIFNFPLESILPNPWQTRLSEDAEHIRDLAADIAANGLLQVPLGRLIYIKGLVINPVLDLAQSETVAKEIGLNRLPKGVGIQLAFGHSRLAAYKQNYNERGAGWKTMPVEIRVMRDEQMADYAWSENERRRNISPIERATAIQKRITDFAWNHDQVGEHLKISRAVVTNALRLLRLSDTFQGMVHRGTLSERGALALLSLFDLPEPLRAKAEAGSDLAHKPSTIIEMAMDGASSEVLRERINNLIAAYGISLAMAIWPLDHRFYEIASSVQSLRCVDCAIKISRDGSEICGGPDCFQAKLVVFQRMAGKAETPDRPSPAMEEPEHENQAPETQTPVAIESAPETLEIIDDEPSQAKSEPVEETHIEVIEETPAEEEHNEPAPTIETQEKPAPAPAAQPAPVVTPPAAAPTREQRTISITLTLMPDYGDARGRQVMIGVRLDQETPALKIFRESEIALPEQAVSMMNDLFEKGSKA